MDKQINERCPHAKNCWLNGNYNYCKTAICKEPLIPKDKPLSKSVANSTRKIIEATKTGIIVNNTIGQESEQIQGELF